jgi:hypothetical protein
MSFFTLILFLGGFLYFGYGWIKFRHKEYLRLSLWAAAAVVVKIYSYLIDHVFHFSEKVITITNIVIYSWWPIFLIIWVVLFIKMEKADKARKVEMEGKK